MVLAGRIRNEGLFGAGFKFDKTNDYIPRKCESFKCYGIRLLGNTGAFKNSVFISGLGTQSLKLT